MTEIERIRKLNPGVPGGLIQRLLTVIEKQSQCLSYYSLERPYGIPAKDTLAEVENLLKEIK